MAACQHGGCRLGLPRGRLSLRGHHGHPRSAEAQGTLPPPPVLWGALLTGLLSSSQEGGEGGFVREFVQFVCKPLMKQLLDNKTKVVTNAGGATPLPSSFFEEGGGADPPSADAGMNPVACKAAIEQAAKEAGLPVPTVAAVVGCVPFLRFLVGSRGVLLLLLLLTTTTTTTTTTTHQGRPDAPL